jgi:uncharacterized membrane protein YkvA (DUF1232 family)
MTMSDRIGRVFKLLGDPRVPRLPKAAVLLAVLYLLSPVDLIPDLIVPVVGYLDDVTLIWVALRWLIKQDPQAPALPPKP